MTVLSLICLAITGALDSRWATEAAYLRHRSSVSSPVASLITPRAHRRCGKLDLLAAFSRREKEVYREASESSEDYTDDYASPPPKKGSEAISDDYSEPPPKKGPPPPPPPPPKKAPPPPPPPKKSGPVFFADGYSEVTCTVDTAPATQQISFKEHACGQVPSCRLTELGMSPRLCFDFCRKEESANFFGLQGQNCYCATYFVAGATLGQGECSFKCEGDTKESCGGPTKQTLFEMHMCADSADEATLALKSSSEEAAAASSALDTANGTIAAIRKLAKSWEFGVCSIPPEGKRVCDMTAAWLSQAGQLQDSVANLQVVADVLAAKTTTLEGYQANFTASGGATGAAASLASSLELTTDAVSDASAKVHGATAGLKLTTSGVAGPFGGSNLSSFADVFQALGAKGWSAVCGLVPIPGEGYAALSKDDPAACGARCLSLNGGVGSTCAAFNYQYSNGLASCQLLTGEGLVQPETSIAQAVPIFEVSKMKRDSLGITSLGCYSHGAFMGGHPRGPLGTEVIKEVAAF